MYVGGLRARLIRDNTLGMLREGLTQLGWFDSGRNHRPVSLIEGQISWDTEALPNIVALSFEHTDEEEAELGSVLSEVEYDCYVDVYSEGESVGLHLGTDIKDMLAGKFSSLGFTKPAVDVYDLSQATPGFLFSCDIDRLEMDKTRAYSKPYDAAWYVISFRLTDTYGDEDS